MAPRKRQRLFLARRQEGMGLARCGLDLSLSARRQNLGDLFRRLARSVSDVLGRAEAFLLALAAIVVWAVLGPVYHYSDTWQLVINTATTIVTFLMVFLIQNTQNRDAKAIQLKLDELIRGVRGARTGLVRLET